MSDYHQAKYVLPQFYMRWSRPSLLLSSVNVQKNLNHADLTGAETFSYTLQETAANGDKFYAFFYCDGTETTLDMTTRGDTATGKFDLYVNGILDSSGYDEYLAAAAIVDHHIVLSQPIVKGNNEISLHVNGKNAASTDYFIQIFGMSLR